MRRIDLGCLGGAILVGMSLGVSLWLIIEAPAVLALVAGATCLVYGLDGIRKIGA